MSSTKTIRIVHALGRSGSTIFARCLGCMDRVVLLSEIHPTEQVPHQLVDQAKSYHGYDLPRDEDFVTTMEKIHQLTSDRGDLLVVRDWSHADFILRDLGRSLLCDVLRDKFDLIQLSILRNPDDMWRSMSGYGRESLSETVGEMSRSEFGERYHSFARLARSTGFVRYEELCLRPSTTMREACYKLDIPFDADFVRKWQAYRNVTGDVKSFDRPAIMTREAYESIRSESPREDT